MSEKDEQREEQADVEGHKHFLNEDDTHEGDDTADVEGHKHFLNEDATQEGDDTPDVEGHKHSTSPVRKHSTKHSTKRF